MVILTVCLAVYMVYSLTMISRVKKNGYMCRQLLDGIERAVAEAGEPGRGRWRGTAVVEDDALLRLRAEALPQWPRDARGLILDAWGNDFAISFANVDKGVPVEVASWGRDGRSGTDDDILESAVIGGLMIVAKSAGEAQPPAK